MAFCDNRVATNSVVLISNPNYENYVEGCGRVVEKFGHDGFHSW